MINANEEKYSGKRRLSQMVLLYSGQGNSLLQRDNLSKIVNKLRKQSS